MEEIVNRVEKSGLIAVDLADYCPNDSEILGFDFEPALWNGLVLKEKDFRDYVRQFDWSIYLNKHAYIFCSVDAILPSWAYMLTSSYLIGIAATITVGSFEEAKQKGMEKNINAIDPELFQDGKLIVKGCSDIPNPEALMSLFLSKIQPVCSSVMYGEPCSTVPIFKRAKVKSL